MAEYSSVSDLLLALSEKKLQKMRGGLQVRIDRLGAELRMIDEAIAIKAKAKSRGPAEQVPASGRGSNGVTADRAQGGHFEGLGRDQLYGYIEAMGRPVKPAEMQPVLAEKGFVRKVEAIRVGMHRLARAGRLRRLDDGSFVVVQDLGENENEPDDPLFRESGSGEAAD